MPDLAVLLAADCPKAGSTNLTERCFVFFPQLLALEAEPAPYPLANSPAAVLGAETAALQGVDFDRWTGAARGARHG